MHNLLLWHLLPRQMGLPPSRKTLYTKLAMCPTKFERTGMLSGIFAIASSWLSIKKEKRLGMKQSTVGFLFRFSTMSCTTWQCCTCISSHFKLLSISYFLKFRCKPFKHFTNLKCYFVLFYVRNSLLFPWPLLPLVPTCACRVAVQYPFGRAKKTP